MCGLYYHFNNIRFRQSLNMKVVPFPFQVFVVVSIDCLKGRLLKVFLTHPMNYENWPYCHITAVTINICIICMYVYTYICVYIYIYIYIEREREIGIGICACIYVLIQPDYTSSFVNSLVLNCNSSVVSPSPKGGSKKGDPTRSTPKSHVSATWQWFVCFRIPLV